MSQDNQFQQYGYDQFLKAPKKQRLSGGSDMWDSLSRKLRSPVVATIALLATGALFTGVIIMAYPSGNNDQAEIPIIKADLTPIKSEPFEQGGMEVPYSDSTILSSVGQEEAPQDMGKIENLLEQANEDLTSKEDVLQQAMGDDYRTPSIGEAKEANGISSENAVEAEDERIPQERGMYLQDGQSMAASDIKSPEAQGILQKIDPERAKAISEESGQKIAQTASAEKPIMHAAATSPETIDFVRSALSEGEGMVAASASASPSAAVEAASVEKIPTNEESSEYGQAQAWNAQSDTVVAGEDISAPRLSEESGQAASINTMQEQENYVPQENIEPAAGAASPAINIERGNYYVQLASITDSSRADSEFAKLQKKFSVLKGLDYRVQEANLDKGTFFRIQAGPFSKDSAKSICDAIKEKKPGGCILVK